MEGQFLKKLFRTLLFGAGVIIGLDACSSPVAAQCADNCCGCDADYYGDGTLGLGDMTDNGMSSTAPSYDSFAFADGSQGSVGNAGRVYGGYIDNALPMSQVRFRFDASFDFLQPDRAEFFYAACGCNGNGAPGPGSQMPLTVNSNVDSQEFSIYLESARSDRFSWFVELPFRRIDPESNNIGGVPTLNSGISSGLADMNAGFKYAMVNDCCRTITFQFRVYAPTGDSDRGLGNNHVSLEPAILYQRQLGERTTLFAELRDWIPIGGFQTPAGEEYSANILRYGAGLGYTIYDDCKWKVTPMAEFVGWSIFGGQMVDTPVAVVDASGTIVNVKLGARINNRCGLGCHPTQLYVGYGRALTGDTWYQDIVRVDYSILF